MLLLGECAAPTHMSMIQLIWQEVYKLCQRQCFLDHSVMLTHFYLGVIFLAVLATIAYAGKFSFVFFFAFFLQNRIEGLTSVTLSELKS